MCLGCGVVCYHREKPKRVCGGAFNEVERKGGEMGGGNIGRGGGGG